MKEWRGENNKINIATLIKNSANYICKNVNAFYLDVKEDCGESNG